eukprot:TRINITY_DN1173_c1_g1_i1.p1 TRINITY_DN1173_c1_g1~~TRINITY_DN1173_c1_g1_i1.p1  ORF type:complete len:192 (-),score=56.07 TRINITY_DN1173_c1_g1_i1:40-615(-)
MEDHAQIEDVTDIEEEILSSEQYKEAGNEYYIAGDIPEAIIRYSKGIEIAPDDSNIKSVLYSNRAACYTRLENWDNVVKDCELSLEINPEYIRPLLRRAAAQQQLEEYRESLKDYNKILELDPTNKEASKGKNMVTPLAEEEEELEREKMMTDLKDVGNKLLGFVGLSLDNFQTQTDPQTGNMSVQFVQKP